jgi:hypothetical protein
LNSLTYVAGKRGQGIASYQYACCPIDETATNPAAYCRRENCCCHRSRNRYLRFQIIFKSHTFFLPFIVYLHRIMLEVMRDPSSYGMAYPDGIVLEPTMSTVSSGNA